MEDWVDFDEFVDVSLSADVLLHALSMAGRDPLYWKWAIIAAHGVLSGACVCRLTQTNGSGALDEKSTQAYRDWRTAWSAGCEKARATVPKLRLGNLRELLERLPPDLAVKIPDAFDLELPDEPRHLWLLNKWRSEFMHFKSQSWSIERRGLPSVVRQAVRKTTAIIADPHDRFPQYRADLEHRLAAAEKLLDGLEATHGLSQDG